MATVAKVMKLHSGLCHYDVSPTLSKLFSVLFQWRYFVDPRCISIWRLIASQFTLLFQYNKLELNIQEISKCKLKRKQSVTRTAVNRHSG
jgi:hypothetical protein